MKVTIAVIVAISTFAFTAGLQAQQESKESSATHWGAWELVSFKYGTNQPGFTDFPESQRRIKLITETHFTWVQFDATTKEVNSTAGGTYSLSGNTYTESIDFGLGMDTYFGAKHAFTIRVEGDKFFLSGSLADGLKIEEVWQRVKGGGDESAAVSPVGRSVWASTELNLIADGGYKIRTLDAVWRREETEEGSWTWNPANKEFRLSPASGNHRLAIRRLREDDRHPDRLLWIPELDTLQLEGAIEYVSFIKDRGDERR